MQMPPMPGGGGMPGASGMPGMNLGLALPNVGKPKKSSRKGTKGRRPHARKVGPRGRRRKGA